MPQRYEIVEKFIEKNNIDNFTDRVDACPLESLAEYGFIRNSETDEVYRLSRHYITGTLEPNFEVTKTTVTFQEVLDKVQTADDGFFDFIGDTKVGVLMDLDNDRLAWIIHSIQQYYGVLY